MAPSRSILLTVIVLLIATVAAPATAAPARAGLATVDLGDWGHGGYLQDANDRGDVAGALNDENVGTQPVMWPRHGGPTAIGTGLGSPAALNNRGDVVGANWLWNNGRLQILAAPSRQMRAVDINDRRQIVGDIDSTPSSAGQMFLWQNGRFTVIAAPAGMKGHPIGINNRGEVLGYVTNADWSVMQGFVWRAGTMTLLEPMGGGVIMPRTINDRGQVVGYGSLPDSGVLHPFLWENGRTRDLMAGSPAQYGQAQDINDAGDVVGTGNSRAVLWRGGRTIDLAVPGGSSSANRINERGDIAGWAVAAGGAQFRAFRWSNGRVLTSEAIVGEGSAEITGIDRRGDVVGMIDDLISPPRPVRWLAR